MDTSFADKLIEIHKAGLLNLVELYAIIAAIKVADRCADNQAIKQYGTRNVEKWAEWSKDF